MGGGYIILECIAALFAALFLTGCGIAVAGWIYVHRDGARP